MPGGINLKNIHVIDTRNDKTTIVSDAYYFLTKTYISFIILDVMNFYNGVFQSTSSSSHVSNAGNGALKGRMVIS